MEYIYLDNAATTPIDSRVADAMLPFLNEKYGNPSSIHKIGREAKVFLEEAREAVSNFIGASPSEIYFTSGGTESNNFAIKGIAFNQTGKKNHIISSKIEHSAVLDTLDYLHDRFGYDVTYVPTDRHGIIDIEALKKSVTSKTFLICMMHSNNELGVINDIKTISEIAQERNIFLHTDSVQSIGKTHFNVNELNCNTATLSAHKIYGPKGIGALYIRKGTPIDKFIHGGKQERDRRGGTENMPAIAGFREAIKLLTERMDEDIAHYEKLNSFLLAKLKKSFGDSITINSLEGSGSLPNIVNISFVKDLTGLEKPVRSPVDPDTLLIKLDLKGIAVSSGSACASGSIQPSHVLKAIGYDDEIAKSSLRVSFGRENREDEIDYLINTLEEIINS